MSENKLAPLSGLLGIAGVITGLALDNAPHGNPSDAAVVSWFAEHGVGRWFASSAAISLGGIALLVFAAVLGDRAERAGAGRLSTRVLTAAATGWGVCTVLGGALWGAPAYLVKLSDVHPTAALLYLGGPAYAVLVAACAFAAALTAAALTTASWRTGILPRWLTVAGIPASLLMLTNVLMPMLVITLWFVAVSIALTRRTPVAAVPAAEAEYVELPL